MELEFIDWLRANVPRYNRARLGLTDDAAIVSQFGSGEVVVTTDLLTDGVDFELGKHDLQRIGRQALGANLSDLAAMAAKPVAAFISIALPTRGAAGFSPLEMAIGTFQGLLKLAADFGVAIAGGDTNTYEGPLVLSVTALGEVTSGRPLTRSGGQPGDWLLVTGDLGGSILGHMLDFTPRVREAILLHQKYQLTAGIDISDGLALDTSRLAAASGCGAVLFPDRVPVSSDAIRLSEMDGVADISGTALRHALGDGQDFELLIAASPEAAEQILQDRAIKCAITHVGELTSELGLWQESANRRREPMEVIGWRHN
jgi:thiamine-monophosphate kinase